MATVDDYIAALPEEQRIALEHLRGVIEAACPGAVEAIGYGMPGYKFRGRPLISIAAWKSHLSLYGGHGAIERHAAELGDFDVEASTIRFPADRPLPDKLVRAIVSERLAEIDAELAGPKPSKR